jgi:hypothetical protein
MYSYDRRASTSKTAVITDGPVGRVLQEEYNKVHDLEHKLQQTLRDYGDAEHFMGGPAEHASKDMIKKVEACLKELEHLTKHTFSDLLDDEAAFTKKFGDPKDYADQMRKKTFPRSAADAWQTEAAQPAPLDPSKPLEGNAVAYFTVGGDAHDGDPESVSLTKGHVPVQEVMKYLHKRTPDAKAQPGHHPGEILVHDIGWDKKPYSYTTKVQVKSRK